MAVNKEVGMHAIAPYLFRVFNKDINGPVEKRYSTLDKLGSHDLYDLLKRFIKANQSQYIMIEESKHVYMFSDVTFDDNKRYISGIFNVGIYGVRTDIINITTGSVDFEKAKNNAEIIKHYVQFYIPKGVNEAIACMHTFRGTGVKTLFYDLFSADFKSKTNLTLQMNPLSYDKAMSSWMDGEAKELKLTKFEGVSDIADQIRKLGHNEKELIIKPKRNKSLGKLRDFLSPGSEQVKAIEAMEKFGSQVKTVIEINGKRRTFSVGRHKTAALCEIEMTDSVELNDGMPELKSMNIWVTEIINDFAYVMYPGMDMELKL